MKELMLVHQLGLCGMGNEADLDLVVNLPQKLNEPEEERPGQVLFHGSHASRHIHHGENHRIRLIFHIPFQGPVPQILTEKGKERLPFVGEISLSENPLGIE